MFRPNMKLNIIARFFSHNFGELGKSIADNPSYYVIIPLAVTLMLSTGLQNIYEENDTKFLIAPEQCRSLKEEEIIGKLFNVDLNNDSSPWRLNREPSQGSVLVIAKDGGSIFRESIFEEVIALDQIIGNITIEFKGEHWNYKGLCAKDRGQCYKNSVLLLKDKVLQIKDGKYLLKYPVNPGKTKFSITFYGSSLGGVKTDEDGYVKSAKSLRLFYFLNDATTLKRELSERWQDKFLDVLADLKFNHIVVNRYARKSQENELVKLLRRVIPLLAFSIAGTLLFSIITCMKEDWVISKPWTGVIAATSAGMALASSFGLVIYFGEPLIAAVGSAPFLILGIGMDDTFVLLAAWRRTDPAKSVRDRLSEAYSESAVSITITSLTNFIAFISGVLTPFRVIRIFCIFASTAVLFSYIYQITFVGGCMAICGYLEEKRRHSVFGISLKKNNDKMGCFGSFLSTAEPWKIGTCFKFNFWNSYAKVLTYWPVKVLSLIILVAYLSVGFWGITKLKFVSREKSGAAYDSYYVSYYENIYKYYNQYRDRIQIVIDQEIDYSDVKVQQQVEDVLTSLENTGYVIPSLTESWLRYYLRFLRDNSTSHLVSQYDVSKQEDFILVLRKLFLRHPAAQRFARDISFNRNYTAIIGSRFLCQTNYTNSLEDNYRGMTDLREITDKAPFSIFPYHFLNYYVDEIDVKTGVTIQILSSVAIVISIVCFLFIPNIFTTVVVTATVISIETSVMGYMALWDIVLGPISIMILTMCAGFSVDYSAHLTYAYQLSESDNPNERMISAITSIGMAIFQGSISTILAITPLAFPIAYIFLTAFKIIFLVILFSTVHGLFFLPILLSLFDSLFKSFKGNRAKLEISEEKRGNDNGGYSDIEIVKNSNNISDTNINSAYFIPYSSQNGLKKI